MSLGKILSSMAFKEQVQRTFILHRDLRCCLSLTEAEKLVAEREQQIREYGKTAFLEFLNSFPLNYSYKVLSSPLKLYLLSASLENLSTYEEQLRYTVLSKLKAYVNMLEKGAVQELADKSEKALIEIKNVRPFDTAHAINFLLLQKDSSNNELFDHCLEVIKKTDYQLFKSLNHRILPIFLKRITLNEWNVFRKFDYLIQALTFDFVPKDLVTMTFPLIAEKISQLQLHTVCYHKIPPAIDFILGYYVSQLESNRELEMTKLHSMLKIFNYLPMGYNEKVFQLLFNKILQKSESQLILLEELPYRRLSAEQLNSIIMKIGHRNFNMSNIVYSAGIHQARRAFLKTEIPKKIYEQFLAFTLPNHKQMIDVILTAALLFEYFKDDNKARQVIKQKTMALIKNQDLLRISKFYTLTGLFNFIYLEREARIGGLNTIIKRLIYDFTNRANNDDFKELQFLNQIVFAVNGYVDSPIPEIRSTISSVVIGVARKSNKFYFQKFPELIFLFCKSQYQFDYKEAIKQLMERINKEDCRYLVELFNRYPRKSLKLYVNFLEIIKNVDSSFETISRFMITSSYTHFTSSRGELHLEFRRLLEAAEPTLSAESLKGYYLPEITALLKFCTRFYYFISEFSRKMLLVSLNYIQNVDCTKDGGKFMLNFIQESISLKIISNASEEIKGMILSQVRRLCEAFPDSLMLKAKAIEFRWLLGADEGEDRRALQVQQILSQLSNSNYSEKHASAMIVLLKLSSLSVVKLTKVVEAKLLSLILGNLENNEVKLNDIVNQLYLPFKKGDVFIEDSNTKSISKILKKVVEKSGTRQNCEYYMRIVEFANHVSNPQLLSKTLDCMSETHMSPSQIKKIMSIVRFYRDIDMDKFALKLLKDTNTLFDYLKSECSEIMYSVHLAKNEVSQEELQITQTLLKRHEKFILESLSKKDANHSELLGTAFKHLWVSFKINRISIDMRPLFKFVVSQYKFITEREKGHYSGIPNENIAFIYEAVIKFSQNNDPGFIESFQQQKKQTLFKSAKGLPEVIRLIKQDNNKLLTVLAANFPEDACLALVRQLEKQGLSAKSSSNEGNDNIFELNKKNDSITLHAWLRKDKVEYGIFNFHDRLLTLGNNPKGRVNFAVNCLQIVTGLKIIPFGRGQDLKIQ